MVGEWPKKRKNLKKKKKKKTKKKKNKTGGCCGYANNEQVKQLIKNLTHQYYRRVRIMLIENIVSKMQRFFKIYYVAKFASSVLGLVW